MSTWNPSVPVERWEVETEEFMEACWPASLQHEHTKAGGMEERDDTKETLSQTR